MEFEQKTRFYKHPAETGCDGPDKPVYLTRVFLPVKTDQNFPFCWMYFQQPPAPAT